MLRQKHVKAVRGNINIKGHILENIDRDETKKAIEELLPKVDSFAVSGLASVRNPVLEQEVKKNRSKHVGSSRNVRA